MDEAHRYVGSRNRLEGASGRARLAFEIEGANLGAAQALST